MAIKLAEFVARNGRQFEEVTRQRNPGETPFKYDFDIESDVTICWPCTVEQAEMHLAMFRFLLDVSSPVYKWYDQKVLDIKNQLAGTSIVAPSCHL